MAMTKYASLESTEVLGIKSSPERRTANLDKFSDFDDYRTEDGYLYARLRAISSRVNKNHDGWPSVELAGGPEVWERHTAAAGDGIGFTVQASDIPYGFSTFMHKPVFVDHNNSDPSRARGVIVDSKLHVEDYKVAALDPYYASAPDEHLPPTWVELLVEVDAKSFPKFAKAIVDGYNDSKSGIDGWSMGCNVERSVCSICKNSATSPEDYCMHVRLKGANFDSYDEHGHRTSKKCYEDCYGVQFFEISGVFDPADETALSREVRASVNKEGWHQSPDQANDARRDDPPCRHCGGHTTMGLCPTCDADALATLDPGAGDQHALNSLYYNSRPAEAKVAKIAAMRKEAENPLPQSMMQTAPEPVNTLREDEVCPVCGSTMDEPECEVCGYVKPPEGFDNPDLQKAQQQDVAQQNNPNDPMLTPLADQQGPQPGQPPQKPNILSPAAHVTGDMPNWQVSVHPRAAGRINQVEQPIKAGPLKGTNEPVETIVQDQDKPVTSRTAQMIAAATKETTMEKVADAASGAPAAATPDKRVDVVGVGGVDQASNEEASKAEAQIDVVGEGGTGVENVDADSHDSVEKSAERGSDDSGFNSDKTTEDSGPTDTWSGTDGNGVTKQESPVGGDVFPASDEGVKKSHEVTATDDRAFPTDDTGGDGGLGGGGAVQGVKPIAEQFGDRVDVLDHVTSPSNNSGPTKTWSGTDGNGVLKQQDAVTPDTLEGEDLVNLKKASLIDIVKLADLEVELGLTAREEKYERMAALENESAVHVAATLVTLARVRSAGLRKSAATKQAGVGRLPSFKQAATEPTGEGDDQLRHDAGLFG